MIRKLLSEQDLTGPNCVTNWEEVHIEQVEISITGSFY